MSAGNHTPGPWRIGTPPPNGEQTIGHKGLMVAVVTTGAGCPTMANARLISAAPDLLEALRAILEHTSVHIALAHRAHEVIRKATGDNQ